jgi:tetratricopeptide (TPR) repeat protein
VVELILRSPEHSEMVAYEQLYEDLIAYYREGRNFPAALRWAHALVAYSEQHFEAHHDCANACRTLAETYLLAGELNTGLALFARRLQAAPTDIWTYNVLGLVLPEVGLNRLAGEVLERGLQLTARRDPENLNDQLTRMRREVAETTADDLADNVSPLVLAEFRAALALALTAEPPAEPADEPEPYLPPITQLLALGPERDESLYAAIHARGKVLIPELIRLTFDQNQQDSFSGRHAIRLLRDLRDTGMAELGELSVWLEQAQTEGWLDLLTEHCGKIGGYTTPELETIAGDTGYHTYIRTAAVTALVERIQRQPAQREAVVVCMRNLLNRPEAQAAEEETFIGHLIGDALDLDARELYPDIQRAFAEDRVDPQVVDLAFVHERWGLAPLPPPPYRQDGLYLPLRCTACGRTRTHFVQAVLVDVNTHEQQGRGEAVSHDPHIMDREIVCPKCGAVDRYQMTSAAHIRLLGKDNFPVLMEAMAGKKITTVKPNPRVRYFRSLAFGRPMHPLEALAEYRRRIRVTPNDAELHLKFGNLLRTLLRPQAALAEHRRAYALDPDHAEIALACGMSEHDFGDKAAAKACYEKAARLELKGLMGLVRSDTLAGAAFEGLDRLKRGQPSPAYTATEAEPLAPDEKVVTGKHARKRRRR